MSNGVTSHWPTGPWTPCTLTLGYVYRKYNSQGSVEEWKRRSLHGLASQTKNTNHQDPCRTLNRGTRGKNWNQSRILNEKMIGRMCIYLQIRKEKREGGMPHTTTTTIQCWHQQLTRLDMITLLSGDRFFVFVHIPYRFFCYLIPSPNSFNLTLSGRFLFFFFYILCSVKLSLAFKIWLVFVTFTYYLIPCLNALFQINKFCNKLQNVILENPEVMNRKWKDKH